MRSSARSSATTRSTARASARRSARSSPSATGSSRRLHETPRVDFRPRVRKHAVDLVVLFVLASVIAAYVALSQPGVREVVIHGYVLVVGALLMLALVTSTNDALPRRGRSDLERALGERGTPDRRLPDLERAEREVTLATASAYDLHYRLLPHLRAVASARLERRGLRLSPEHAGRWWDLLRPDREPPEEHFGGGISVRDLRALVDDLERI